MRTDLQFSRFERLDDVVIGPGLQPLNSILPGRPRLGVNNTAFIAGVTSHIQLCLGFAKACFFEAWIVYLPQILHGGFSSHRVAARTRIQSFRATVDVDEFKLR